MEYDSNSFVILLFYLRVKLEIKEKIKVLVIEIDSYLVNYVMNKIKMEFEFCEFDNINEEFFVGKYSIDLVEIY